MNFFLAAIVSVAATLFFPADHAYAELQAPLEFNQAGLEAHFSWVQGPANHGESILRIEFIDPTTHAPRDPAGEIKLALWMPSMGHGSAPTTVSHAVDSQGQSVVGAFLVHKMYFIMAGEWEVRITLKAAAGGQDETQSFKVTL